MVRKWRWPIVLLLSIATSTVLLVRDQSTPVLDEDELLQFTHASPWLTYMQERNFVPREASVTPPLEVVHVSTVNRWSFLNNPVMALVSGDDWIAAATPRGVTAISITTGRRLWAIPAKQVAWGLAALASDGERIYWIAREDDIAWLYMVPVRDHKALKKIDLGRWHWTPGLDGVGAGLSTYDDGVLVALSAKDGRNLYAISADLSVTHWSASVSGRFFRGSAPAVYSGNAYVVTTQPPAGQTSYVTALDLKDGSVVWRHEINEEVRQSPMAAHDGLYTISNMPRSSNVYRHDLLTGETDILGSYGSGEMTLWQDMAYIIGRNDATLVRRYDGHVEWHHQVGQWGLIPSVPAVGHVIAVDNRRGLVFYSHDTGDQAYSVDVSALGIKGAIESLITRGPFVILGTNEGRVVVMKSAPLH